MQYIMQYAVSATGNEWVARWTEDREFAEEQTRQANLLRPHEFSRLIERRIVIQE